MVTAHPSQHSQRHVLLTIVCSTQLKKRCLDHKPLTLHVLPVWDMQRLGTLLHEVVVPQLNTDYQGICSVCPPNYHQIGSVQCKISIVMPCMA